MICKTCTLLFLVNGVRIAKMVFVRHVIAKGFVTKVTFNGRFANQFPMQVDGFKVSPSRIEKAKCPPTSQTFAAAAPI